MRQTCISMRRTCISNIKFCSQSNTVQIRICTFRMQYHVIGIMSDDQLSASDLRRRYHAGGSVPDSQLPASQLRARHAVASNRSGLCVACQSHGARIRECMSPSARVAAWSPPPPSPAPRGGVGAAAAGACCCKRRLRRLRECQWLAFFEVFYLSIPVFPCASAFELSSGLCGVPVSVRSLVPASPLLRAQCSGARSSPCSARVPVLPVCAVAVIAHVLTGGGQTSRRPLPRGTT